VSEQDVFGEVKAGYDTLRIIIKGLKIPNRLLSDDAQAKLCTGSEHAVVKINTVGYKPIILKQFQPFTPTATQICGSALRLSEWLDEGQVNAEAVFD
jgi:hypothetical protein